MCDVVKLFGGSCWMESVLRFFFAMPNGQNDMRVSCESKIR